MSNRVAAVPAAFVAGIKPGDLFQDGSKVVRVVAVDGKAIRLEDGTRIGRQVPVT